MVRFRQHGAQGRLGEGLGVGAFPSLGNWGNGTLHLVLNGLVLASVLVIVGEGNLETAINNCDASEAKV